MQTETKPPVRKPFTPHPGTMVQHYRWNGKDEVVNAAEVPDTVKYIYYTDAGQQTSDTNSAAYRVPIVEIDIVSLDDAGHPVEPRKATHFSMTDYGPGHRELRHSTSTAPGHP